MIPTSIIDGNQSVEKTYEFGYNLDEEKYLRNYKDNFKKIKENLENVNKYVEKINKNL